MIRFNLAQIDRLSEFMANLSLVLFASLILPFVTQQQKFSLSVIYWSGVASLGSLLISLAILKGVKK